jgi:predicted XRE-type DNA-binding protein
MKKTSGKTLPMLDYYLGPEGLTLMLDGEPAAILPKVKALELFDCSAVRAYYQSLENSETWGDLDTLETFALAMRLLKKGLNSAEAAKTMSIEEPRFRQFYSYALQKWQQGDLLSNEIKRQGNEIDYCTVRVEKPKEPQYDPSTVIFQKPSMPAPEKVFVNCRSVKNFQKQNFKARMIAEEMKLDVRDFDAWLRNNESYLAVMA